MKIWRGLFLAVVVFIFSSSFSYAALQCRDIGNNLAIPAYRTEDLNSSPYTLILLEQDGSNINEVKNTILGGKEVIIRLGARASDDKSSDSFSNSLKSIRADTGERHFIVMAGHNEANCSEYVPLATEQAFVQNITGLPLDNVTYVTSQIDFYCGAPPAESPGDYLGGILNVAPNLQGVALPFYVGDVGDKDSVLGNFRKIAAIAQGKGISDIYITESGPYKKGDALPSETEFANYAQGIADLTKATDLNIKTLLLFNALYENKQADFNYTKFFDAQSCRDAFRESCTDSKVVTNVCFKGGKQTGDYYVEPIKGIANPTGDFLADGERVYQDLIDQGYQLTCTQPTLRFAATDNTDEIRQPENGMVVNRLQLAPTVIDLTAEQWFDFIDSQVPVWRNQGIYVLNNKDSLEAFWANKDTQIADPQIENQVPGKPQTAAVYNLLDLKSQCFQQVKILSATQARCDKLKPDGTTSCPLDLDIEGKDDSFTSLSLLKQIKELAGIVERNYALEDPITDREATNFCQELLSPNGNFYGEEEIKTALNNTPLIMPTAYRYAFLVIAAELRQPDHVSGKGVAAFNFLRNLGNGEGNVSPGYEVRILAFKIPDFATNRDENDPGYFRDALQLTSDSLSPYSSANIKKEEYFSGLKPYEQLADPLNADYIPYKQKAIDCGPAEACKEPAFKAMVEYVNAQVINQKSNCINVGVEHVPYEKSDAIYSSGELAEDKGDIIAMGKQWISQTFDDLAKLTRGGPENNTSEENGVSVAPFRFLSKYTFFHEIKDGSLYGYLLNPYGYELDHIEDVLSGTFANYDQENGNAFNSFLKSQDVVDGKLYFKLNATDELSWGVGSKAPATGAGGPRADCEDDPSTPEDDCFVNVEAEIFPWRPDQADYKTQQGMEVRIPGAILGRATLWIQKSISLLGSRMHRMVTAIEESSEKPTEDFLLGSQAISKEEASTTACGGSQIADYCLNGLITNATCGLNMCTTPSVVCQKGDSITDEGKDEPASSFHDGLKINWQDSADRVDCSRLTNVVNASAEGAANKVSQYCDTIQDTAVAAGINPRFALAMWGEESFFSAYTISGEAMDFGITVGTGAVNSNGPEGIRPQLDSFIRTVKASDSYEQFLLRYSGEGESGGSNWSTYTEGPAHFCNNREFPARLKSFYEQLGQFSP